MKQIRVLIVDDSVAIRHLLWMVFREDKAFEVVGMLSNGKVAIEKLGELKPDCVTLDIEMPVLGGLETLSALRRLAPKLPVIVLSGQTQHGALVSLEALSRGAVDYLPKPEGLENPEAGLAYIRTELLPKVKAACAKTMNLRFPELQPPTDTVAPRERLRESRAGLVNVLTIGSSMGGPNALAALLPSLDADFPVPVVVAQHMPAMFTRLMAERLSMSCKLAVREASHGVALHPGTIWIAPGGGHMTVESSGGALTLGVHQGHMPGVACRPSVDVLFGSVAQVFGASTLAVILSGMGNDGLQGATHIDKAGGSIIVQDRETSVVWGMPGFVANAGLADSVLPLDEIRTVILRKVWLGRSRPVA
jgi:two-component system chemotaxis response regulator CheB